MSELIIKISETGTTSVFVDGHQISLIQELSVRSSLDRPIPAVEVRFPENSFISQSPQGLQESHNEHLELLRKIPAVSLMRGDEPDGSDSDIILYFLDRAPDGGGRTLTQAIQKDNSWFERTHDFVQWMLPTRRRSKYEPEAPVLSDRDVEVFRVRRDLREAYLFGVDRMERFLELEHMRPQWVRKKDHNHKRITRLLESLMDLGFEERAKRILGFVLRIERTNPEVIDPEAVEFWKKACARRQT